MKITKLVKQFSGLVLAITFFLPLSRCEKKIGEVEVPPAPFVNEDSTFVDSHKLTSPIPNDKLNPDYNIPYEYFNIKEISSWLIFISFFWPLLFIFYFHFGKRKQLLKVLTMVEPFACIGSGYMVWAISSLGTILLAGFLAFGAILSHFISSCFDCFFLLRELIRNKRR